MCSRIDALELNFSHKIEGSSEKLAELMQRLEDTLFELQVELE